MVWLFGRFELDEDTYELRRRGRPVRIEPKVFDVLLYLVRRAERVVSKHELLDALWPGEAVSDSVLPRCIAAARRALGDDRSRQRTIQTVHGRGYRFVARLDPSPAPTGSAAPSTAAPVPAEPRGFVGREAVLARLRAALGG